ncbi:MAG: MASE1 domain-containing protein [Rhodanobacter sp.]
MQRKFTQSPYLGPVLGTGYLLLWLALWPTVQSFWVLPYGLRFGALLLTPTRYWPWLIGGELLAAAGIAAVAGMPMGWFGFAISSVPEPLIVVAGLWLLRRFHRGIRLKNPQEVSRLLLCAVLIVASTTAVDATLLMLIHHGHASDLLLREIGEELLGNYLSILLLVPLMIMLLRTRFDRRAIQGLLHDGLWVLLPSMSILLVLSSHAAPQPQFARVLSLAPVLFFAFRHGWRGASLTMIITSVGITLLELQLGDPASAAAYLFLAVAGTGAILLGSATDALRQSNARFARQNHYLATVNDRLDQLAQQMRNAARGNLQTDENQRRHLAAELHDELGQNITAIQTHVKLAQVRLREAGMEDISTSINAILTHMRQALHRLLNDLRPAVLDEFGLLRAIDEGPIRDLLNDAGITYVTRLYGDPRKLDDDTRTVIYRLTQESATNAVKHAQASEFHVRLRIGERNGMTIAVLDLRDNGVGLPRCIPHGGRGLQGMRDRVTSLGGLFRLRPDHQGVHLHILLRNRLNRADNQLPGQPLDGSTR